MSGPRSLSVDIFVTDEATGVSGKKWETFFSFSQMLRLMNQAKWVGICSKQGLWLHHQFFVPTTHWVAHVLQLPATTANLPRATSFP